MQNVDEIFSLEDIPNEAEVVREKTLTKEDEELQKMADEEKLAA
jgi:hypothetical protein